MWCCRCPLNWRFSWVGTNLLQGIAGKKCPPIGYKFQFHKDDKSSTMGTGQVGKKFHKIFRCSTLRSDRFDEVGTLSLH